MNKVADYSERLRSMLEMRRARLSGFTGKRRGGLAVGVVLAVLSLASTTWAQAPSGPIVPVSGGLIQGRALPAGGAVFKAIPYAAPPVGALRWREPQPARPWEGVRQAAAYGPPCIQMRDNRLAASASEDCLFLNLWTPEWPSKAKKPVMVWLHGGGTTSGSAVGGMGVEPPFDGESLSRQGVIVVTINYRVGIFGLIGHPELSAASPSKASGDYVFMDHVAALKWVRDNIARFGGDPENVTLFGQSAGARYTSFLMTSPLAKGLFHRAIVESGNPASGHRRLLTPPEMEKMGVILGQVLKAPATGTIDYLRGLSPSQIVAAYPEFIKQLDANDMAFDQGMDGYAIPGYAPEVYRSGQQMRIPMIVGSNGSDGGADPPTLDRYYAPYPDLLQRAKAVYGPDGVQTATTGPEASEPPPMVRTDLTQRCAATTLAAWHSAIAPTYQYEFTRAKPAHPAQHSGELKFVFGYLVDADMDDADRKLSADMQKYWANFAKTGDPNGPGVATWPKYATGSRQYMELGDAGTVAKARLGGERCAIYEDKLIRDLDARKGR